MIERDFGDLSGMKFRDALEKYKDLFDIMNDPNHPLCFRAKLPNGESKGETLLRVLNYLSDFIAHNSVNNIAVSCHGGIIQYLHMLNTNEFKHIKNGFCYSLSTEQIHELNNKIVAIMN